MLAVASSVGRSYRATQLLSGGLLASGLVAVLIGLPLHSSVQVVPTLVLAVAAIITESQTVRVASRVHTSSTASLIVIAAVVSGPLGAAIVAGSAMLGDRSGPLLKWLAHLGMMLVTGSVAGAAAHALLGRGSASLNTLAVAVVVASGAAFLANLSCDLLIAVVRQVRPLRISFLTMVATGGLGVVIGVPIVFLVSVAYQRAGLPALLLTLGPLVAVTTMLQLYREKTALAMRLSEGNLAFALSLVRALDARDHRTAGHSAAVAVYARDIACRVGLDEENVAKIQLAGLLHDIGKIGVPSEVLHKQGELDDDEWAAIRAHPEVGAEIAAEAPIFREIAFYIRHHHERPDGQGYPDGLTGGAIPQASAIVGIADAYNAMTTDRPYRDALSPEEAIDELRLGAGTQFNESTTEAFLAVLYAKGSAYQHGTSEEFSIDSQRRSILAELGDQPALAARPVIAHS